MIIEVDKLERRFGDLVAVRDVSFSVERGEIFGSSRRWRWCLRWRTSLSSPPRSKTSTR